MAIAMAQSVWGKCVWYRHDWHALGTPCANRKCLALINTVDTVHTLVIHTTQRTSDWHIHLRRRQCSCLTISFVRWHSCCKLFENIMKSLQLISKTVIFRTVCAEIHVGAMMRRPPNSVNWKWLVRREEYFADNAPTTNSDSCLLPLGALSDHRRWSNRIASFRRNSVCCDNTSAENGKLEEKKNLGPRLKWRQKLTASTKCFSFEIMVNRMASSTCGQIILGSRPFDLTYASNESKKRSIEKRVNGERPANNKNADWISELRRSS